MAGSGTGISAGKRAQQSRARSRRLPYLDIPKVEDPALARAFDTIAEHFRVYDGESNAPRERFVTLQELVDAGLVSANTKGGHSYIAQVLNQDVSQKAGSTANPTLKGTVLKDTALGARTPGGAGGSNNPIEQGKRGLINKLSDIGNVRVQSPAQRDFLYNDGGKWINYPLFKRANRWDAKQNFAAGVSIDGTDLDLSGYLQASDNATITGDWTFNSGDANGSNVVIGESTTLRGDNNDSVLDMYGEHSGVIYGLRLSVYSTNFSYGGIGSNPVTSMQLPLNLQVLSGKTFGIYDSDNDSYMTSSHDGTDLNSVGTNMTDWNITGITSFNVPALASTGAVTGSNLNVANWDTAYGWGDHAGVYEPVDADILRADTADVVTAYIDFNATDAAPAALHSRLTRNMLYIDGKEAIDGNDVWLRLNQNGDFANGIYSPGNFRTDGRVFVSSSIYIENGTTGSIQIGDTGITPTVDIGCRNSSYCHFDTTASAGFYWYKDLVIVGTKNIKKASHGNYLYHASTAYDNDQNGQITFGTGAASGGTTGDIHFQYT